MSNEQRDALKIVSRLLEDPYNQICADCQCKPSKWASTTLGVFICIDCSGVHRSLGTHISFVRSCTLDSWSMDQVRLMEAIGNRLGNSYWEAKLPSDFERPGNSNRSLMQNFIKEKYQLKKWADEGPPPHIVYKHLLQKQLSNTSNIPSTSTGKNSRRGHSKSRNSHSSDSSRHSRSRQTDKNDKKELQFHRTETTEPQIQVSTPQQAPVTDPKKPLDDFFMEQPKRFIPKPYIPHKKVVYDMPKEEPDYEKMAPDEIDKFFDKNNDDEDEEDSSKRKNSLEKAMLSRIQNILQSETQNTRRHSKRHYDDADYDYYNEEEEDTSNNPFGDAEETNTANLEAFFDKQKPKHESKKSIVLPKTPKQTSEIEPENKEPEIIEETPIQSHPIDNINLNFQFIQTDEGNQMGTDNNNDQFWDDENNSENEIQIPDLDKLKDIQLEGKAISNSAILHEPNKDSSSIEIEKVDPEAAIKSYNPFDTVELNDNQTTLSIVQQLQQNSNPHEEFKQIDAEINYEGENQLNQNEIEQTKFENSRNSEILEKFSSQSNETTTNNQVQNIELIENPNNEFNQIQDQNEHHDIHTDNSQSTNNEIHKQMNQSTKNDIHTDNDQSTNNEIHKQMNQSTKNDIHTDNDQSNTNEIRTNNDQSNENEIHKEMNQLNENEIVSDKLMKNQNLKLSNQSNYSAPCYYPDRPTKLTLTLINSMSFIPPGETIEDEMIDDFFAEAEQLIQTPNNNRKSSSKRPQKISSKRHTRSRRHNYDYDDDYDEIIEQNAKPTSTTIPQTPTDISISSTQKSAFAPPPARKPGAHIPARLQKKIEVVQEEPRKRRHHRSRRSDNS